MAEYTPDTNSVKETYADGMDPLGFGGEAGRVVYGEQFDRWLAEHDREIALNAYDSGYHDGYNQLPFYESLGWE